MAAAVSTPERRGLRARRKSCVSCGLLEGCLEEVANTKGITGVHSRVPAFASSLDQYWEALAGSHLLGAALAMAEQVGCSVFREAPAGAGWKWGGFHRLASHRHWPHPTALGRPSPAGKQGAQLPWLPERGKREGGWGTCPSPDTHTQEMHSICGVRVE